MNIMKTTILTMAFLTVFTFAGLAQGGLYDLPTDYIRNSLSGRNNLPDNVTGSVYFSESFKPGTVTMGDKTFNSYIRYNGLRDEFEIQDQVGEITSLLRREDMIVTLGDATYEIFSYKSDDGYDKKAYFKRLNDGPTKLLVKEDIILKEAVKATSTYAMDKPAALEPQIRYYLKTENAPAVEVRLRKKDLLRILDNDKVEDFVKENKLKLKDENEVVQTLEYYNAIQ